MSKDFDEVLNECKEIERQQFNLYYPKRKLKEWKKAMKKGKSTKITKNVRDLLIEHMRMEKHA
jgi:hypothetical protein